MVHIYNGILLSHKREWNCVICRDVDGPGDGHLEWSKSEREKQVSYINIYMIYVGIYMEYIIYIYYIFHIYYVESRKMVQVNLFAKKK